MSCELEGVGGGRGRERERERKRERERERERERDCTREICVMSVELRLFQYSCCVVFI